MRLRVGKQVLRGIATVGIVLAVGLTSADAASTTYYFSGCTPGGFAVASVGANTSNGATATFAWYECAGGHGCGTTDTYASEPSGSQIYGSSLNPAPTATVESVTVSLNGTFTTSLSGTCS